MMDRQTDIDFDFDQKTFFDRLTAMLSSWSLSLTVVAVCKYKLRELHKKLALQIHKKVALSLTGPSEPGLLFH